ncbi:MAG: hypothetical protein BroJett040_24550 [Oligoflexia bacterium]|nr:MAG: hypothetical protein BroJett040_24550 [Oligoflexia bacterium]
MEQTQTTSLDKKNQNLDSPGYSVSYEFRCPQCFKLYKVQKSDILSSQPHFECQACQVQFTFDYPPKNPRAIYTRVVNTQLPKLMNGKIQNIKAKRPELKKCPKCQTMNPRSAADCIKCQVVFEKVEALSPADAKAGGAPSLLKAWQDLMHDYNNLTKHLAFVDRCEEMHALPFALKKYKELKEVQPHDSLAQQMVNSVLLKALEKQAQTAAKLPLIRQMRELPWRKIARVSPVVISILMIMIGTISHANRNLVGIGASLLLLTLGLAWFFKGRIHPDDFLK